MDDHRKWNRKQLVTVLGFPLGTAMAALIVLLMIPDGRSFTVTGRWFALASMMLGVLAGVWGLCTLTAIQRMGRKALQSRDALVQQFSRGQTWLPRNAMGITLLSMSSFSALLTALAPLLEPFIWSRYGRKGVSMDIVCLMAGAMSFMFGLWMLFRHIRPAMARRQDADIDIAFGRAVSRSEAPLVWKLVDEVTLSTRVVAPDNIILGLDTSFYATESPLHLSGSDTLIKGRTLYLSAPYLAYLARDEAAVIIGHELAHFTGADTEYTLKFAGIYAAAQRHYQSAYVEDKDGLEMDHPWINPPIRALVACYLSTFDLAVQHWSREREFLADRIGAGAVTNEAAARALLRTTMLGSVIEQVLLEFTRQGGRTSHPGGLLAQVFDVVRKAQTLDPLEHLQHRQPHPRDSHPPTIQRIEALGITPDAELAHKVGSREPGGLLQELGLK